MLRLVATITLFGLAVSGTVSAQTAPPLPGAPSRGAGARAAFGERAAAFALRGAYRAIADAEARGASTYVDQAKTHYRDALARFGRHDAGAAGEALAATALARAAVADHPVPVPRDIPPPPALAAGGTPPMARPMMRRPMGGGASAPGGPQAGGPMRGGFERGRGPQGAPGMAGRFDPARLAADAKLADTAEARDLAQKALDADVARTRAAFSGNQAEAMRQGRLASALAMAVRALAMAEHPPAPGTPGRRAATVGLSPDP